MTVIAQKLSDPEQMWSRRGVRCRTDAEQTWCQMSNRRGTDMVSDVEQTQSGCKAGRIQPECRIKEGAHR